MTDVEIMVLKSVTELIALYEIYGQCARGNYLLTFDKITGTFPKNENNLPKAMHIFLIHIALPVLNRFRLRLD